MFRAQPVANGPAGPDRTRRPVGTDGMYAVHDDVRPMAGGPVGRFPVSDPLKYSQISSPDDSYQPLFTGPLGTNDMNEINDRSRPTASGPLGRQCSLDPMGPREMLSLGDGNQPQIVGPVGRPWIPEWPGDQVKESDFKQTTQTRSESESETGVTDSVIRTESDAHTDRTNIGMASGPTDSNVIPSSGDTAVHSLRERLNQTKSVSKGVAGIPDPEIQTGSEVHTDQVNVSKVNGQTDSSVTPPSSDSGIHSLGEQWENMSANSMSTESMQTVKTFYGGARSQDKENPQETRPVGPFVRTVCGKNDSIDCSTTGSGNSDIAAMSDFSDEEDGPNGDVRPLILTECVRDDSVREESNDSARPVPEMTTAGVGHNSLDLNDKDYWTKFRLLTRQAFLLDNVKLSESDYPDAVKEVVTRSRLTVIEFNKGEDLPLEQYSEGELSDDSDADSTSSRYKSNYGHNLEDYRDWHYDRAPTVSDVTADDDIGTVRNADNNDGQCPAVREGNEVGTDKHSEPGGGARSELSSEKAVGIIDTFDVDSVINDNIMVNIRESAGVSDMHDDEIRMVSMITVEVSPGNTSLHSNNSLGLRDCVAPVSEEEQDSAAHMDLRLGVNCSLRNLTVNCFGVCDVTHRLNHPGIDWCWVCIDRLIWGYRVSCLAAIVTKNRTVGMSMSNEGSGVCASTQGFGNPPVIPCDVIPVFVWMTEKFKDVLNKVMLVDKATVNSRSLQWGEDNRQARGRRASVDNRPIRVVGRFGCLYSPVQGADWLDVLSVGGGPVGKDVGIGYIGDGFPQYQ